MFKYLPTIIAEVVINLGWSGEGWEEMGGSRKRKCYKYNTHVKFSK